jgi:hypothetical protein
MMQRLRNLLLLAAASLALASSLLAPARAALQTGPVWYLASAAASSAWHYRVPLTVPGGTSAGATAVFRVDFNALLAQLGVAGTFDVNSPRVVDAAGTLVPTQEFLDAVYNDATDAVGNGRGDVRFLATSSATTYYLYFDITANGAKATNPASVIGGNFENATVGSNTIAPPGWTLTRATGAIDSQVRPSESLSIGTDGTVVGNGAQPRTVDGSSRTGNYSYLLGARSSNETTTGTDLIQLSRTIAVPATNPGVLNFHFRTQGWDSNDNGQATNYDYLRARLIDGAAIQEIVGPLANNYVTAPFAPNKGLGMAATTNSGYGQYNGFDTDTTGTHRAGMTVARGAEPWWDVTVSLAPYAGKTITLLFSASHTVLYRSWWHLDDIEWSIVNGTIGTPQGFGAVLELPVGVSTSYLSNQPLVIRARLDAGGKTGSVVADLYRPNGTLAVAGIILYNDGTHGDATSGDALWTNNGSILANPTYTFQQSDPAGTWSVVLRAADSSAAASGQQAGLVRVAGQPITPVTAANFSNVASQSLTFTPYITVVSGKVFTDNGAGGVTALDGLESGTEPPLAAIVISLRDGGGALLSQTQTRGDGLFDLQIPTTAVGIPVTLSVQTITGYALGRLNPGTTGGTVSLAAGSVTFTPASITSYSGVVFSELPASTLTASQNQSVNAGGVAAYPHRFTAGANGTQSISLVSSPPSALPGWAAVLYRDIDCSGVLKGNETQFTGTVSVLAGDSVCFVVRDIVPANAALNSRNQHTLTASLNVTQGVGYAQAAVQNIDVTTVGTGQGAGLTLTKAVRNLTTSGAFGTSSQALPGESLQYRLTFRNDTAASISGLQLYDSVPGYTLFVSAACDPMPTGLTCLVSKAPPVNATVGDIQWSFTGSVPAGGQGSVTFTWAVMN